jgi:hypothetical protein
MSFPVVLTEALADVAVELRRTEPALYEKVDMILADPDRRPTSGAGVGLQYAELEKYRWAECGWCGENFVAETATQSYCGIECATAYRMWRHRRMNPTLFG